MGQQTKPYYNLKALLKGINDDLLLGEKLNTETVWESLAINGVAIGRSKDARLQIAAIRAGDDDVPEVRVGESNPGWGLVHDTEWTGHEPLDKQEGFNPDVFFSELTAFCKKYRRDDWLKQYETTAPTHSQRLIAKLEKLVKDNEELFNEVHKAIDPRGRPYIYGAYDIQGLILQLKNNGK